MEQLRFDNTFDLSRYGGKLFKLSPVSLTTTIPLPVDPHTPEGKEIRSLVNQACSKAAEKFAKDTEKEYREILLDVEHKLYARAEKELPEILRNAQTNSVKAISAWLELRVSEVEKMAGNASKTFESVFAAEIQKIWAAEAAKVDKKFKKDIADKKIIPSVKIGAAGVGVGLLGAAFLATLPVVAVAALGLGGFGLVKKIGGGLKTVWDAITKDWPRHATASAAVRTAAGEFNEALRAVDLATKAQSLGRPKAAEARDAALEKAHAAQLKLKNAITDLETWNRSLKQDIENGAALVKQLEEKLEAIEKRLAGEHNVKKAQDLHKACEATVKEMGRRLDQIELARTALADWEQNIEDAKRLVATKDCTAKAAGELAEKLKRAAASDSLKQAVSGGKVVVTAVASLVDMADAV